MRRLIVFLCVVALACSDARTSAPARKVRAHSYLYVFTGAAEHPERVVDHSMVRHDTSRGGAPSSDFLAVVDADSTSPRYAAIVAVLPVGARATMPHHTEMQMPPAGQTLFANAFMTGTTYRFDLSDPLAPKVAGVIDTVPGLHYPHSYARLTSGDVIATYQYGDKSHRGNPGGIARFSPEGALRRAASAFDSLYPDSAMRTYSLDVSEKSDRVVTTSSPMDPDATSSDVVQLWRLSDLMLLRTLIVPRSKGDSTSHLPFEVRLFPDGKSAILNTYNCGFYYLSSLDSDAPRIEEVGRLPQPQNLQCAVPLLIGHWWIVPIEAAHSIRVYDVADPHQPKLASQLDADSTFSPHWMSRELEGDRIVVTAEWKAPAVRIARFDSTTGELRWDASFGDRGGASLGISFNRTDWPQLGALKAYPHGAVFSRK